MVALAAINSGFFQFGNLVLPKGSMGFRQDGNSLKFFLVPNITLQINGSEDYTSYTLDGVTATSAQAVINWVTTNC